MVSLSAQIHIFKDRPGPEIVSYLVEHKDSHAIYLFAYQKAFLSMFDGPDCSIHGPVSTSSYNEGQRDRHYITSKELVSFCRVFEEKGLWKA